MNTDLKMTKDGSHTLYRKDLDEHYHSIRGARQESMHVYINPGLKEISKEVIRIFEVGFGTGLNTILSLIEAEKMNKSLVYDSIEKYPLPTDIINQLNYPDLLPAEYREVFYKIHTGKWGEVSDFGNMELTKIHADIRDYTFTGSYDIIYFDAFGPEKQPELWTADILEKIYHATEPGGLFITYSVKGEVRRLLQGLGFRVERLKGPPGKKEILRAVKNL